jgi:hypothetical protein
VPSTAFGRGRHSFSSQPSAVMKKKHFLLSSQPSAVMTKDTVCLARPSAVQGTQCLSLTRPSAEGRRARERKTPILINEKVGHLVDSNPDQLITSPQSYPLDYHFVSLKAHFDLPLILHNRRL